MAHPAVLALCLLLTFVPAEAGLDDLWLRYSLVSNTDRLAEYRSKLARVVVEGDPEVLSDPASRAQLVAIADELQTALVGLTGRSVPRTCCSLVKAPAAAGTLLVTVAPSERPDLRHEGFRIGRSAAGGVTVRAASASGAWYGSFALLAYVQRAEPVPEHYTSAPAMGLRVWNLWDNLDGTIERGYAGNSIVWPMASYDPARPPPRRKLYLSPCNASDPYQQWDGATLAHDDHPSSLRNRGSGECLTSLSRDPVQAAPCAAAGAPDETLWLFNHTNRTIAVLHPSTGTDQSRSSHCLDINGGHGPDIDLWSCHGPDDTDYTHQQFFADLESGLIRSPADVGSGQCLTIDRSPPNPPGVPSPWSGGFLRRFAQMMRFLKSAGMNGLSLLNVNSCGSNVQVLESQSLRNVSKNLGPIMERFAITPYISACYAAPFLLGNVSSDPLNPEAQRWWQRKVDEIYAELPGFGGFVVKADSEGNQGPQAFNRTEAQGANMLARALRRHGGIVMWRAFVYGGDEKIGHEERAKEAYDTFMPLDGHFDENVAVQIKHGPMDFQVREPVSPLFGALRHTNVMMEVQASQEYTGQQIHVASMTSAWESYLRFDTHASGPGSTVASLLSGVAMGGMACVSNMGDWANWTGHVLSASNAYGCGRLGWDPTLSAARINREWAAMTFPRPAGASPRSSDLVVRTVTSILQRSWGVFEGYTSPLGIGFMCSGCGSWPSTINCAPPTKGPGPGPDGAECPFSSHGHRRPGGLEDSEDTDHYWLDPCVNYGSANYSTHGLGCERTSGPGGTGYAAQYAPAVRDMFNRIETCPVELLLFFHNLPWSHPMSTGGRTVPLIEFIAERHAAALDGAAQMAEDWDSLRGLMDEERFEGVRARFRQQVNDARVFSKVVMGYYRSIGRSQLGGDLLSAQLDTYTAYV